MTSGNSRNVLCREGR